MPTTDTVLNVRVTALQPRVYGLDVDGRKLAFYGVRLEGRHTSGTRTVKITKQQAWEKDGNGNPDDLLVTYTEHENVILSPGEVREPGINWVYGAHDGFGRWVELFHWVTFQVIAAHDVSEEVSLRSIERNALP